MDEHFWHVVVVANEYLNRNESLVSHDAISQ